MSTSQLEPEVSFKTEFAVEMHCEACVKHIKSILSAQPGVTSYEIDLSKQRLTLEGTAAPSRVARALKQDGRQVIVRGTGAEGGEAAVCIFESFTPEKQKEGLPQDVNGIARMVQVGKTTLLDLTIKHDNLAHNALASGSSSFNVSTNPSSPATSSPSTSTSSSTPSSSLPTPTQYGVYIAKTGDISSGASSTGGIFRELGLVELRKKDGYGDLFKEVKDLNIWEIIGRAMVIAPLASSSSPASQVDKQTALKMGPGILAGVIARSAGVWTNDKTVCACSSRTMWQESAELDSKL